MLLLELTRSCQEFLDQFGPQLVDWIASQLSPGEVCNTVLGLGCTMAAKPKYAVYLTIRSS